MKTRQAKRREKLRIVQLNIEVPEGLHRGLKVIAAMDRRSIKALALDSLQQAVDRRKPNLKLPSFDWPGFQTSGVELLVA